MHGFDNLTGHLQDRLQSLYHESTEEVHTALIVDELNSLDRRFDRQQTHAEGGMKRIFKVDDLSTKRTVALARLRKESADSMEHIEAFLREARITASLQHPNIVPIYDIGLDQGGAPYFTMKFLKDQSLKKVLKELAKQNPSYTQKYPFSELLNIFIKICEAAAFAHAYEIIHLDLKPSNIMIGDYGEVYVCDWGLAKYLGSEECRLAQTSQLSLIELGSYTLSGVIKGSPGFMAPEQVDPKIGKKDYRTDIYALGAILYALLTYRRPYHGMNKDATLHATVFEAPQCVEELSYLPVPESVAAICRKAMAKNPDDRYQCVNQIIRDVRFFQEGFATQAEHQSLRKYLFLSYKRHKFKYTFLLSAALITVLSSVLVFNKINYLKDRFHGELKTLQSKKDKAYGLLKSKAVGELTKLRQQLKLSNSSCQALKKKCERIMANPIQLPGRGLSVSGMGSGIVNPDFTLKSGTLSFWFKVEPSSSIKPEFFQLGNMKCCINKQTKFGGFGFYGRSAHWDLPWRTRPFWNEWHHFACNVMEGGNVIFYIDGIAHHIWDQYDGNQPGLALGRFVDGRGDQPFKGCFDELTLWERVLTQDELKELMCRRVKKGEKGLKAYYNLDHSYEDLTGGASPLKPYGNCRFN